MRCTKTESNWVYEGHFVVLEKVFLLAIKTEVHSVLIICKDITISRGHAVA